MSGYFITFEGGEGAGKTSALKAIKNQLVQDGYKVLSTREPGGIEIAEQIRDVILNPAHTSMDGRTEALLYAAASRQHLVEKVFPALAEDYVVLCDRFIDSSLAYQGYARNLGMDEVLKINGFAIEGCMPHITLLFNIQPEKGLERIADNQQREKNRLDLEQLQFHQKVYEAYQWLYKQFPERIYLINAEESFDKVVSAAYQHITSFLNAKH